MPQTENRTRITLFLPAPTKPEHHKLINRAFTRLIKICQGFTSSTRAPSSFEGVWFDSTTNQLVVDQIVLILADAPFSMFDTDFLNRLKRMKLKLQRDFDQQIIWLTVQSVERISANDFKH